MSDTLSKLGEEVMAFADHLRDMYGDDVRLNASMIVADISVIDEDGELNRIDYACSDTRRYVQVALLEEAVMRAEESRDASEITEDD